MTKAELAGVVAEKTGVSKKKTLEMIDGIFGVMAEKLAEGERIQLVGFGTFDIREVKEREGRNPHSGEKLFIPAHCVPRFKAGKQLRDKVQSA